MKYLIALIVFVFNSCDKESTSNIEISRNSFCHVKNPLSELSWLKKIVDNSQNEHSGEIKIFKCIYNNQESFLINLCWQCPDSSTKLYDCQGNVICDYGSFQQKIMYPDFGKNLTEMSLIYSDSIVQEYFDSNFCQVNNSLTDLPWLKKMTQGQKNDYILNMIICECLYDRQEGFLISYVSSNSADSYAQFCDCSGNVLCHFGGESYLNTCPDFYQKLVYGKVIWKNE